MRGPLALAHSARRRVYPCARQAARGGRLLANHTILVHVLEVELTAENGKIQADGVGSLGGSRAHLDHGVLKVGGQIDLGAVFVSGYGVNHRRAGRLHDSGHLEASPAGFDVNVEFDQRTERFQDLGHSAIAGKQWVAPGTVDSQWRILRRAFLCWSSALSSMKACWLPLPEATSPGHCSIMAHFRPLSEIKRDVIEFVRTRRIGGTIRGHAAW